MKKAALILLMLSSGLALAQKTVPYATEMKPPPPMVTKVVRVHNAKAQSIANLVGGGGAHVIVTFDDALQVIVLKGRPDDVASAEQTIRELDVPSAAPNSKDIEVIVSVIGASGTSDLAAGQQMPEGMAPVVKQLRAIFPYKNYQLLSSMLLRSREGSKAENSGIMKGLGTSESNYFVGYDGTSVSSEAGKPLIHLRSFRFHTRLETPPSGPPGASTMIRESNIDIATDVDLSEGQKTVVGKANTGSNDSALFVVLTARLVD